MALKPEMGLMQSRRIVCGKKTRGMDGFTTLSEKDWVDLRDFVEALRLGRARWPRRDVSSSQSSHKDGSDEFDDIEF